MATMLATIPFVCLTLDAAQRLVSEFANAGVLHETRADYTQIVQAPPGHFDGNNWYVILHTGNLLGMIHDLNAAGIYL